MEASIEVSMCAPTNNELRINNDATNYVSVNDDAIDASNDANDYVGVKDDANNG